MILNEVNFYSSVLSLRSSMCVLAPQRTPVGSRNRRTPGYRVLYLLHGHTDDHTAWQRWTAIERYAEGLDLLVVMPAVQLSFYTDMAHGGKYWQFISVEIPAILHDLFPLSTARADTFVAGLSMGGYGAFKLALTLPERYAAAASLSGVLDIRQAVKAFDDPSDTEWLEEMRNVFGNLRKVPGSPHDLFRLARTAANGKVRPRLYQCCGTEDTLYLDNVRFRDFVSKLPLDLTYEEGPGEHNWAYWDKMIQNVLAWMFPVAKTT
jgi:putative tributyrin esterase